MRSDSKIDDVCRKLHRSLVDEFKYALTWGTSAKHTPQRVGLLHALENEDVVQIVKKK